MSGIDLGIVYWMMSEPSVAGYGGEGASASSD